MYKTLVFPMGEIPFTKIDAALSAAAAKGYAVQTVTFLPTVNDDGNPGAGALIYTLLDVGEKAETLPEPTVLRPSNGKADPEDDDGDDTAVAQGE